MAVNRMAPGTGDLALGMAALNASYMGRFVQMAFEAGLIHIAGAELGRIPDFLRRAGFGVPAARAVAGLARLAIPPAPFVRLDDAMRTLEDRVENIFVAGLADLRAHIGSRLIVNSLSGGRRLSMGLPSRQEHA